MFKKGFTLVEVLVVIVIIGLVMGAIYSGYLLSQRASREGEISAEITQNGRVILERMTREIRQAREIVNELPEEEPSATSTIIFEDGHISDPYHYIHYFHENSEKKLVKREVVGFYFSSDTEETLVSRDAIPPTGQTLETKTLEEAVTIGEYVTDLNFWETEVIHVGLTLQKKNKTFKLKTQIFGRNL